MPRKSNADQASVLIVSDDTVFARALTARWQSERNLPAFTVMGSDLCCGGLTENFHAAIVGKVEPRSVSKVIKALHSSGNPIVQLCDGTNGATRDAYPRLLIVQQTEGWLDTVVLLTSEVLRRREVVGRIRQLERESCQLQRDAMLGRYVLDMRHTLNNALTAVLGNAELLLLEPGMLNQGALSQVETVRNMALRIHEIMQRFSSLEKELNVIGRQAEKDSRTMTRAASAT